MFKAFPEEGFTHSCHRTRLKSFKNTSGVFKLIHTKKFYVYDISPPAWF